MDELKPLFEDMPKAKTAKIVRNLIDVLASLEGFDELQVELCQEQIAWSKKEKRTFLRHRVELRLAALYLKSRRYTDSLRIISSLAREVKKLDDKLLLVDIHLVESKIHYALNDLAKAKAALTASRTSIPVDSRAASAASICKAAFYTQKRRIIRRDIRIFLKPSSS